MRRLDFLLNGTQVSWNAEVFSVPVPNSRTLGQCLEEFLPFDWNVDLGDFLKFQQMVKFLMSQLNDRYRWRIYS